MIKSLQGIEPKIGKNCFIAETAAVIGKVEMGEGCSIWYSAVLRGDVNNIKLGNRVNVQDCSCLHTSLGDCDIQIADDVTIGHNACVHGAHIESHVLIGMGATVLDDAVIGEGAIIAAGALVLKGTQVGPGELWGGVPAKFIKKVDPEQSKERNQGIASHYLMYAEWYKDEDEKKA